MPQRQTGTSRSVSALAELRDLEQGGGILTAGQGTVQWASCVWHTADHRKKKLLLHRHLSQLLLSCRLRFPFLGILGGPRWKLYRVFIIYYVSQREKAANTSNACTVIYTVISSPLQKPLRTYVTMFTFKEKTSFGLPVNPSRESPVSQSRLHATLIFLLKNKYSLQKSFKLLQSIKEMGVEGTSSTFNNQNTNMWRLSVLSILFPLSTSHI